MKKLFAILKNNIIACVCFLLAVAVILTGTISYSKYISTDTINKESAVGSFYCSGTVDSVSSLAFANSDFWNGNGDDKIAMNTVHSINFAINNYQETTDEYDVVTRTVSAVKMRYTLVLTMPVVFAEKIAFQLFENYSTALLPQIVVDDLIKTANGTYDTDTSEDYQEEPADQLQFTVTKSSTLLDGKSYGAYSAIAPLDDGEAVIKFDPVLSELNQVLKFRLWDVSKLEGYTIANPVQVESGDLLAPVLAEITSTVPCYRISISMPQFIFGAGTEEQSKYSIRFAPTSMLDDWQLGGELCEEDGALLESFYAGKSVTVNALEETVTDKDSDGNIIDQNSYYVFGNPRTYEPGESEILSQSTNTETTPSDSVTTTYDANTNDNGYLYFDENWLIVDKGSSSAMYAIRFTSVSATQEIIKTTTTTTTTTIVSETTDTVLTEQGKKETITQTISETTDISAVTETKTITNFESYTVYTYNNNYYSYKKSGTDWVLDSEVYNTFKSYAWPREYSGSDSTENTVTETYARTIERKETLSAPIVFKSVYCEAEEDVKEQIYDSVDNALNLFAADGKQVYYLSHCYSKSYPASVNVIFEQIQS